MKIKSGFVLDEVGGAFLWSIISDNDVTEEDLVDRMMENYGIDRSLAERDVKVFVEKLSAGGLLE